LGSDTGCTLPEGTYHVINRYGNKPMMALNGGTIVFGADCSGDFLLAADTHSVLKNEVAVRAAFSPPCSQWWCKSSASRFSNRRRCNACGRVEPGNGFSHRAAHQEDEGTNVDIFPGG